jgi:AcrR family transcriptional regulator
MADGTTRRLSPEVRSAAILEAAKRLLDREGVPGFSLEAVAREAGVAASLPRHYFGGSVELLSAATIDVLKQVERAVRAPQVGVEGRVSGYLDVIRTYPWGHSVWMRAGEIHPSIETLVNKARVRLGAAILGKPWSSMSRREQIHARGSVGFAEAVVSDWIERGFTERKLVIEALIHGMRTLRQETTRSAERSPIKKPKVRH